MPLKPIPNGHTETVEIKDGDTLLCTYEMRQMVSVVEMDKSRFLRAEGFNWAERAMNLRDQFAAGQDVKYSEINHALEQSKRVIFDLIFLWMAGWSHPDTLTRDSLERLEQADKDAVLDYIKSKIRREDEDEANPTPPPAPSTE